jgi:hypothetical protein
MEPELYSITQFCKVHNIDPSFITSLEDEGLIEITLVEESQFIQEGQLHDLEIYTRWNSEMGINPEGIDALKNVLDKIRILQVQINYLKHRLRLYENLE